MSFTYESKLNLFSLCCKYSSPISTPIPTVPEVSVLLSPVGTLLYLTHYSYHLHALPLGLGLGSLQPSPQFPNPHRYRNGTCYCPSPTPKGSSLLLSSRENQTLHCHSCLGWDLPQSLPYLPCIGKHSSREVLCT